MTGNIKSQTDSNQNSNKKDEGGSHDDNAIVLTQGKNDDERNKSAEAVGGAIRGASRSLGRSLAARLPIGQLPKHQVRLGMKPSNVKLPTRHIAKLSDRVSSGLDLWYYWTTIDDDDADNKSKGRRRLDLKKLSRLAKDLVKGTLLGMVVFETYGHIVAAVAPPINDNNNISSSLQNKIKFDEYARASLLTHFGAGFCGGAAHGVLDGGLLNRLPLAKFAPNVLHHSLAHSVLFGTYESTKRMLLLEDETSQQKEFLLKIITAGGLAGQCQHVVSHYSEALLVDRVAWPKVNAPTWRSVAWAFPGTAVGFVAFEYGKLLSDD